MRSASGQAHLRLVIFLLAVSADAAAVSSSFFGVDVVFAAAVRFLGFLVVGLAALAFVSQKSLIFYNTPFKSLMCSWLSFITSSAFAMSRLVSVFWLISGFLITSKSPPDSSHTLRFLFCLLFSLLFLRVSREIWDHLPRALHAGVSYENSRRRPDILETAACRSDCYWQCIFEVWSSYQMSSRDGVGQVPSHFTTLLHFSTLTFLQIPYFFEKSKTCLMI